MRRIYLLLCLLIVSLLDVGLVAAQEITPTATITVTTPVTGWVLPEEGIQPFTYTNGGVNTNPFGEGITAGTVIDAARSALTTYQLFSQGENDTWVIFAIITMVSLGGTIIFNLMLEPPEI